MAENNNKQALEFYGLKAVADNMDIVDFSDFVGKTVIIVNIDCTSKFLTKNLINLAHLLDLYYDSGLRILLFPLNLNSIEEFNTTEEISKIVNTYSKKFIILLAFNLMGNRTNKIYEHLNKYGKFITEEACLYSFTKFIINGNGILISRILPILGINQDDSVLVESLKLNNIKNKKLWDNSKFDN